MPTRIGQGEPQLRFQIEVLGEREFHKTVVVSARIVCDDRIFLVDGLYDLGTVTVEGRKLADTETFHVTPVLLVMMHSRLVSIISGTGAIDDPGHKELLRQAFADQALLEKCLKDGFPPGTIIAVGATINVGSDRKGETSADVLVVPR